MENLIWASINLLLMHIIRKVLPPGFVKLEPKTNSSSTIESRDGLKIVLQRPWMNLPHHILDSIANHLGPIDLFSFRGTCKEWRSCAPSEPSPPCHHHPDYHQAKLRTMINNQQDHLWFPELWFLLYGEDGFPNCVMFDPCSKKINRSINNPELGKGVVCIASSGGWLLFLRYSNRSMFFFCPLSRVKIDLPKLPSYLVGESLRYRIASFSSPPTSPDCVVCVFSVVDSGGSRPKVVVNLLRRGANEWDQRLEYAKSPNHPRYVVACATVLDGSNIYIMDDLLSTAVFSLKEREWTFPYLEEGFMFDLFGGEWRYFALCKGLTKQKLGFKKCDSLSICGTVIQDSIKVGRKWCIFGEKYGARDTDDWDGSLLSYIMHGIPVAGDNDDMPKGEEHQGVWFEPRFFLLPPNYTW